MKKKESYLFTYFLLVELICVIYYLMIPTDLENQIFAGYSPSRWIIFISLFFLLLATSFLFYSTFRPLAMAEKILSMVISKIFSAILVPFSLLTLILLLLSLFSPLQYHAYIPRLLPLMILVLMIEVGYFLFYIFSEKMNPWNEFINYSSKLWDLICRFLSIIGKKLDRLMESKYFWVIPMIVCIPLLFTIAFKFSYPSGYAGLYTLSAELLTQNGFKLPEIIPYYGPGGMPFVYPPLSFYVMAFFIKVFHIPSFIYLRFAPPLFLLISVIPFSLLGYRLTGSKIAGIFSTLIMFGSNLIFWPEATSGGVVRGLALLFAYLGMYFFLKAIEDEDRKSAVLAAIFYSCIALSHLIMLGMAVFFAAAVLLNHFKIKKLLFGLLISLFSMVLVLPWVLFIVHNYGSDVFLNASQSHANLYFLFLLEDMSRFIPSMMDAFRHIFAMKYFWGLCVFGFMYLLTKNRIVPLWFLIMLFFYHLYEQFFIISGSIMAGAVIALVYHYIRDHGSEMKKYIQSLVFWSLATTYLLVVGYQDIVPQNEPVINKYSMDIAGYIKDDTPTDSQYLMVSSPNEAEWYPYLFSRVPLVGNWGGEWLGNYRENLQWTLKISDCNANESYTCVYEVIVDRGMNPDYIITKAEKETLTEQMQESNEVELIYSNKKYIVWQYNPQ